MTCIPRCGKDNTSKIRFATWNARSIKAKNKSSALCDFVIVNDLDILAITETWLSGDSRDNLVVADIKNTLPNFTLQHCHRPHGKGGGVAVIVRDGIQCQLNNIGEFISFEYMDLSVSSIRSTCLCLVVIYRPPPNNKNKLNPSLFLEDFSSFLGILTISANHILLAGDFNVHVDVDGDREAIGFHDILDLYDLQQHVRGATHSGNHTLDLLISRRDEDLVSSPSIHHDLPSDHAAVKCLVNISRPPSSTKRITSRRVNGVDKDNFCLDVRASSMLLSSDVDSQVTELNTALSSILDKHAPLVDRTVVLRPHAPWYSASLHASKQLRRRCERKWMKSKLAVDREIYMEQCVKYTNLLAASKTEFHRNQIASANQHDLFRVVNKLSCPKTAKALPSCNSAEELAIKFSNFFSAKIIQLHDSLNTSSTSASDMMVESCASTLSEFSEVSDNEVFRVIKSASITSCPLDPLPSSLFKSCINELVPVITKIANNSFISGHFPAPLKHSRIIPLLKKTNLDIDVLTVQYQTCPSYPR